MFEKQNKTVVKEWSSQGSSLKNTLVIPRMQMPITVRFEAVPQSDWQIYAHS